MEIAAKPVYFVTSPPIFWSDSSFPPATSLQYINKAILKFNMLRNGEPIEVLIANYVEASARPNFKLDPFCIKRNEANIVCSSRCFGEFYAF